jgi:sugar/nucleoside kinase (ribokinase family)
VPIIAITKGKQGGTVYQPNQPTIDFQPLPVNKVVDETGIA